MERRTFMARLAALPAVLALSPADEGLPALPPPEPRAGLLDGRPLVCGYLVFPLEPGDQRVWLDREDGWIWCYALAACWWSVPADGAVLLLATPHGWCLLASSEGPMHPPARPTAVRAQ